MFRVRNYRVGEVCEETDAETEVAGSAWSRF